MIVKQNDISLRNSEYYGMLEVNDKLYSQSKKNIVFDDLMPLITSVSYQNIIIDKNIKETLLRRPWYYGI